MSKIAIVLFNLGGPDQLRSVKPFLFNLFNDSAIIQIPKPIRYLLAKLIANKRQKEAEDIYRYINNKSPLLDNTTQQAKALEKLLADKKTNEYRVFIAMRYWHPMTAEVVCQVKKWQPDQIVLLPLYPQLSTTTTLSSYKAWQKEAARQGLTQKTQFICCYPENNGFIQAQVNLMQDAWKKTKWSYPPRILFSAHGLPQKIVNKGDPYPDQVKATAVALIEHFPYNYDSWRVCFQSRVGPVAWIKPYTDKELIKAAKEKIPIMIVPLSFVSEHAETLVELDIQYKKLVYDLGGPLYVRVPTVGTHPLFIEGLGSMIEIELGSDKIS